MSYIGFPLMSVCCNKCTLEESTSYAISQVGMHHLKRLGGGTCLKKGNTKHKRGLGSISILHCNP